MTSLSLWMSFFQITKPRCHYTVHSPFLAKCSNFELKWNKRLELITGCFGKGAPGAFAVEIDVIYEALVFLFGPSAFVGVCFLTARWTPHLYRITSLTNYSLLFKLYSNSILITLTKGVMELYWMSTGSFLFFLFSLFCLSVCIRGITKEEIKQGKGEKKGWTWKEWKDEKLRNCEANVSNREKGFYLYREEKERDEWWCHCCELIIKVVRRLVGDDLI